MKILILISVMVGCLGQARADDLAFDSCVVEPGGPVAYRSIAEPSALVWLVSDTGGAYGLSCNTLVGLNDEAEILSATVIAAASVAYRSPMVAKFIDADLKLARLTLENPVVLAVVVMGTMVTGTVYFLLKKSAAECRSAAEEEKLQQMIEERTGAKIRTPLRIQFEYGL